jgi:choice-of-anchor B domain-containing protein
VYAGNDADYVGKEVCFSSNENHFEIVDVTQKSSPVTISSLTYEQLAYVHQGWLTEDHQYFLLGDELDETTFELSTRTHVIDVSDLDEPKYLYAHEHETQATDHNLYVLGNRVYEANYSVGLRVLEFGDLSSQEISEIAFFDTFTEHDEVIQMGAWSVYPFLPSGNILVSDIQNGLFVLTLR